MSLSSPPFRFEKRSSPHNIIGFRAQGSHSGTNFGEFLYVFVVGGLDTRSQGGIEWGIGECVDFAMVNLYVKVR